MGAVFRGTHVMLGRPVAVKLINPDLVTSPEIVRRFQREARAATQLSHPNVVDVYDLGQTPDGTLYIVMELVSGPSLKDAIRASGSIAPARIVRILGEMCDGLAQAHDRGIIHRDLKPQNVMLTVDADGVETAKIVDFGIAKTFEPDAHTQLTATGSTIGTPYYMSPEQASGAEIDGRSDIYSLGIILYEMLTGVVPFDDPSLPSVLLKHMTEAPLPPSLKRPDLNVPPALEAIALRCLAKTPAERFENAEALAVACAAPYRRDPTTRRRCRWRPEPRWEWTTRHSGCPARRRSHRHRRQPPNCRWHQRCARRLRQRRRRLRLRSRSCRHHRFRRRPVAPQPFPERSRRCRLPCYRRHPHLRPHRSCGEVGARWPSSQS